MSDQNELPQPPARWILPAILLTAVVLRTGATWHWRDDLRNDRDAYLAIANNLLNGDGYSIDGKSPTAFRPPLYPIVLAVAKFAGGTIGIAIVQILLGVGTVYVTYRLGCSLISTKAGLIAAALVAVDPLLLRYTPQLMTETLFTFLVALLLWSLSPPHPLTPSPHLSTSRAATIGFLFGLCALCRPTIWAWGLLMAAWWVVGLRRGVLSRKRRLWAGGVVAAVAVVTISPWVMRNASVFGRPVVMTTHGGYTLLLGNNPVFYEEVVRQPWGTTWQEESLRAWQQSLEASNVAFRSAKGRPFAERKATVETEVERDRRLFRRALANIREDWNGFFAACWLRVQRFWNVVPTGEAGAGLPRAVFWGMGLYYVVIFAAAVAGLLRLQKAEWPHWLPLVLLIVAFTAVHTVYWSNTRMRSPLVPVIALLAARAICWRRGMDVRAKR